MDEFYLYVSIAAVIILILSLAAFGVTMYKVKQLDVFPPFQNTCPDYWDISGNYCVFPNEQSNAVNTGDINVLKRTDCNFGTGSATSNNCIYAMGVPVVGTAGPSTAWAYDASYTGTQPTNRLRVERYPGINKSYVELNGDNAEKAYKALYPGRSVRCAKKRWAELNQIAWDGISNFNGC